MPASCLADSARRVPKPAQIASCLAFVRSIASQQRAAELRQLLTESGIALSVMTVVSIGLGYLVAGRVLRPLRTITTAARSVSASSLHARLALPGPDDELKELGDTFDELLARLEAAFAAQRQFVANASHEMRSPLARQRTMVEVALADPAPSVSALQDVCKRVLAAGEQQERLIEALLTLARSQRGLDRRETIDLAAITDEVVTSRQADASLREVDVRACMTQAFAMGDANLAERLVANLIDNAVRHNMARGTVDVTVRAWADHAVISVANTGPVIASHEVTRLFQPFQRGCAGRAASRDGLGLGLSIVGAVAQAHDAWLQATAQPGGGLSVDIGFPLAVPLTSGRSLGRGPGLPVTG
jgi:signal transduction histidine kinase